MVKTSTVLIATGNESNFYRSVQEVPELLRRQLIETTNSENSGMIVIADNAGKEQWTEIVAHREAQQSMPVTREPCRPRRRGCCSVARSSLGFPGRHGRAFCSSWQPRR